LAIDNITAVAAVGNVTNHCISLVVRFLKAKLSLRN